MDAVLRDIIFAYLHHFGIGLLIVCLAMETALMRGPLTPVIMTRLARIDAGTGIGALIILSAGVGRVLYGLKGPAFYMANHVFWTKMLLFVLIGLASAPATIQYLKWRRAVTTDASFEPAPAKVRLVRRHLAIQWGLLLLVPLAAVLMARGFGMR